MLIRGRSRCSKVAMSFLKWHRLLSITSLILHLAIIKAFNCIARPIEQGSQTIYLRPDPGQVYWSLHMSPEDGVVVLKSPQQRAQTFEYSDENGQAWDLSNGHCFSSPTWKFRKVSP